MRSIIDMPLPLQRLTAVQWDIDWGGQSAGADAGGGDQLVISAFPRFVAELGLRFERDALGHWRALRARLQGRQNALRVRMIDPVTMAGLHPAIHTDLTAWLSGMYDEPRPQVPCRIAALAGAVTLAIDETFAAAPVPVGAHLSYQDWPFLVLGRSGAGASTVLEVSMLRRAIPVNGQIDLIPRGVFTMSDPTQAAVGYGRQQRMTASLTLTEWITRP